MIGSQKAPNLFPKFSLLLTRSSFSDTPFTVDQEIFVSLRQDQCGMSLRNYFALSWEITIRTPLL